MKNIGQYIFNEIENSDYFKSVSEKILINYASKVIDNNNQFSLDKNDELNLYRFIDLLASTDNQKARMKAYHLISLCEPFVNNTELFNYYSSSVYSKLGLYGLKIEDSALPFDRKFEIITKKTIQRVNEKYILTDTQFEIFKKMIKAPHFSFSGPTSLGKSFLIRRYIDRIVKESSSNIVILVPTKALINQFTNDIKDELGDIIKEKGYLVQTHGSMIAQDKKSNYIFILTPERLLSLYAKRSFVKIDFLFIDEAHKLSFSTQDDTRSLTAYTAIDKTLEINSNVKLIFSAPNIANPEIFLDLFGKDVTNSIKVEEAPVAQNLYLVDFKYNNISYVSDKIKIKLDLDILNVVRDPNEFIFKVGKFNSSNMVYCASRNKAINSALDFYHKVGYQGELSPKIKEAIEKISSLVHLEYYLCKFLERKIAYHHGQLPQIIRNIIEKLFREGEIDFIFCTPTLVEGVNMPTKNIFINCDRKIRLSKSNKINNPNKTIAFWNLAGRAGRYCKELSGNIFCIQNDSTERWDDLSIFNKNDNEISTSIDKINNKKGIENLKDSLTLGGNKDSSNKMFDYLSNLLSIDIIRFEDDYSKSFILKKMIDYNRDDIINLAKSNSKNIIDVPFEVVDSFKSLRFSIQNKVYNYILEDPLNRKFPKLDTDNIKETLQLFYILYEWDNTESSDIRSLKQLDYYSVIMSKWVSGVPLSVMIGDELRIREIIYLEPYKPPIKFDRSDLVHVNFVIDNLLSDIENILTFIFEKYFNHYYKCLTNILGEDNAGHNWSTYLEYGTKNHVEIGLQNLGLSRVTAHAIVKNEILRKLIDFNEESNEITKVNKYALLENIKPNSLEYEEVSIFL
ncbi:DEAD/DEAH box helicase [Acinetobacter terrestris]|uniref:DEAD/DEAH box helicase n=1 Tax=Acinetobacter terrestris TaxID=2529843 RepID=UPI003525094D